MDLDTTPPTLAFIELAPTPSLNLICGTEQDSVFQLLSGEELYFEVLLSDDQALSQFKIDIHNNFDCHGHGGASTPGFSLPSIENQTADWTVLETVDVTGQEETITRRLQVPENVTAGNYHAQLQVLDESGNDIPFANFFSAIVVNSKDVQPPVIGTDEPQSSFTINKGEQVRFVGNVIDDFSLSEGGNGVLFLSYTDLSSGNTFTTNKVFPFDDSVETNHNFDFSYTVPNTITNGSYLFTLRAQDGHRNVAEPVNFNVMVIN